MAGNSFRFGVPGPSGATRHERAFVRTASLPLAQRYPPFVSLRTAVLIARRPLHNSTGSLESFTALIANPLHHGKPFYERQDSTDTETSSESINVSIQAYLFLWERHVFGKITGCPVQRGARSFRQGPAGAGGDSRSHQKRLAREGKRVHRWGVVLLSLVLPSDCSCIENSVLASEAQSRLDTSASILLSVSQPDDPSEASGGAYAGQKSPRGVTGGEKKGNEVKPFLTPFVPPRRA